MPAGLVNEVYHSDRRAPVAAGGDGGGKLALVRNRTAIAVSSSGYLNLGYNLCHGGGTYRDYRISRVEE